MAKPSEWRDYSPRPMNELNDAAGLAQCISASKPLTSKVLKEIPGKIKKTKSNCEYQICLSCLWNSLKTHNPGILEHCEHAHKNVLNYHFIYLFYIFYACLNPIAELSHWINAKEVHFISKVPLRIPLLFILWGQLLTWHYVFCTTGHLVVPVCRLLGHTVHQTNCFVCHLNLS